MRSRRSKPHARPVAVVSWPASSSVTSWSRSSSSSSIPARSSSESTSPRSSRRGSARRRRTSSTTSASARALRASQRFHGPTRPSSGLSHMSMTSPERSTSAGSAARIAASRAGSETPKTARRITSKVSSRMRGCSSKARPSGQRSTSSSVTCSTIPAYERTASPWKAGSMSLRRRRWSASSVTSTERSPRTGARIALASPACRVCASPVKTSLIASGSAKYTSVPIGAARTVKTSP